MKYRAMHKKELAKLAEMSPSSFRSWLNVRLIDELKKMDYEPRQKYLTPKQVHFLCNRLAIIIDE
ncbi:MAG: hypothetical protein AB7U05_08490 [Mangrovibacterium sp.]